MDNAQFGVDVDPSIETNIPQDDINVITDDGMESSAQLPRKRGKTAKQRINEIQREKYQAMEAAELLAQEKAQLQQEVSRLKQLNDVSTSSALDSYELTALERLEAAKQAKEKAIEGGDVKAQVEADISLSNAVADYKQVQQYKNQENLSREQERSLDQQAAYEQQLLAQQYQNASPDVLHRKELEDWIVSNDWYKQDSPNFNPQMAQVVNNIADALDAQLYRTGNQNAIFSKDYFDYIDEQIMGIQRQTNGQYQQSGNLTMRRSNEPVNPVSRGYPQTAARNSRDIRMSSEEMDMARRLGVKPEEYARQKINVLNRDRFKGTNNGYR